MRMYVPACGDTIRTTSDWHFGLYGERRNDQLLAALGHTPSLDSWGHRCWPYRNLPRFDAVCPADTVLKIERVYVRAQSKSAETPDDDYDSLTFRVMSSPSGTFIGRFWAKLADVNRMEFEPVSLEKKQKRLTPKAIMKAIGNYRYDGKARPAFYDASHVSALKAWWDVFWPRLRAAEKAKRGDNFRYYWRDDNGFDFDNFVLDLFGHYSRISWACKFERLMDGTITRSFTSSNPLCAGMTLVITSDIDDAQLTSVSFCPVVK